MTDTLFTGRAQSGSVNKKTGCKRSFEDIVQPCHDDCEICEAHQFHIASVKCIRSTYRKDKERKEGTVVVSCDLQKVILLPRLPGYRESIFTSRLIAFNKSFVPLGKTKAEKQKSKEKSGSNDSQSAVAVCWHEAIMGRMDEDICSAYLKFLKSCQCRDAIHVKIWCDNCGGQNTCWTLYTALVNIVNCDITSLQTITLEYFKKGHSFMSADHFHAKVEKQLKYADKVYDYKDYITCISKAPGIVEQMDVPDDFYDFEKGLSESSVSKETRPLLVDTASVQFRRGSTSMFFQTWEQMVAAKENDQSHYDETDFLQKKFKKDEHLTTGVYAKKKTTRRGITEKKKTGIIDNLGSLMPSNRLSFYKGLHVNNTVVDLTSGREQQRE